MRQPIPDATARIVALSIVALTAVVSIVAPVSSQEHAFAGSAQTSYTYVVTDPNARRVGFDGFVPELSMKLTADVNDHISAQVKTCYGCHGFELAMAFVDFRLRDELNIRIGRFNPSFGEFPLRQDPANHATIDRPLPYDMGRMLRLREFGMSVLPAPYVDTGIEVSGTHWFGDSLQLDYAVHAVGGFRGNDDGYDLDFVQSRTAALYYVDNNSQPAFGGRVALTLAPSARTVITLGSSALFGRYDPARDLDYLIVGADLYARLDHLMIRAEYLIRRTEMFVGPDPSQRFTYGPGSNGRFDNFFRKDGYYVESELEVGSHVRLLARFDGLRREGNVPVGSPLRSTSALRRYTLGMNILPHPSYRLKIFAEWYDFSDFEDALAVELAIAAAF